MKKEIEITKKKTGIFCDICNERADCRCMICCRAICHECTHEEWDGGDYPNRYCRSCWDAGEPFRRKRASLENHFDIQKKALDKEWIRVAKRLAKK